MCVQDFGDSGELVHGGIHASAMWLKDRLLCLSQVPQPLTHDFKPQGLGLRTPCNHLTIHVQGRNLLLSCNVLYKLS